MKNLCTMKRLLLLLAASAIVAGCAKTSQNQDTGTVLPLETPSAVAQDTPPPIPAELQTTEASPDSVSEMHSNQSYTPAQGDSIKKTLVPPAETPGKGYDGRLPKDSVRRAEMIKHQALRRVQDSIRRLGK